MRPAGFHLTEEHKRRISIANKGKHHLLSGIPLSAEHKKKISDSKMGHKMDDKTKSILWKLSIGRIPWNKGLLGFRAGRKVSNQTREKQSLSLKGKRIGVPNLARRKQEHKTDESKLYRTRIEYVVWRRLVYERDKYVCQKCLQIGSRLNPHHISNFSTDIESRFIVGNGITFCTKCHISFHRLYGKKNNNLDQVLEFIKN